MFDCRNFHCWDHRRSVAKLAKLTDSDELAFSDKLVGINPSNYSAWHYRGTLLLRTKPPADDENTAIDGECLEEEMKVGNVVLPKYGSCNFRRSQTSAV